jgi:hypothetical protein
MSKITVHEVRSDGAKEALTQSEIMVVVEDWRQIKDVLTHSVSQKDYDELIPAFCEYTTRQMWMYVGTLDFFEWCRSINADMARNPLLKILRGKDTVRIPAAAFMASACNLREATPLLIELLTVRFRGEVWPEYQRSLVVMEICGALARLASLGDKRAAEFLESHSKITAWRATPFLISGMNREASARYLWHRLANALAYNPSTNVIEALRESGYEYASNRVALIEGFLQSGDSITQYHREVLQHGLMDNKYLGRTSLSGNRIVEKSTGYSGRVRWVRESHGDPKDGNPVGTQGTGNL